MRRKNIITSQSITTHSNSNRQNEGVAIMILLVTNFILSLMIFLQNQTSCFSLYSIRNIDKTCCLSVAEHIWEFHKLCQRCNIIISTMQDIILVGDLIVYFSLEIKHNFIHSSVKHVGIVHRATASILYRVPTTLLMVRKD